MQVIVSSYCETFDPLCNKLLNGGNFIFSKHITGLMIIFTKLYQAISQIYFTLQEYPTYVKVNLPNNVETRGLILLDLYCNNNQADDLVNPK